MQLQFPLQMEGEETKKERGLDIDPSSVHFMEVVDVTWQFFLTSAMSWNGSPVSTLSSVYFFF